MSPRRNYMKGKVCDPHHVKLPACDTHTHSAHVKKEEKTQVVWVDFFFFFFSPLFQALHTSSSSSSSSFSSVRGYSWSMGGGEEKEEKEGGFCECML